MQGPYFICGCGLHARGACSSQRGATAGHSGHVCARVSGDSFRICSRAIKPRWWIWICFCWRHSTSRSAWSWTREGRSDSGLRIFSTVPEKASTFVHGLPTLHRLMRNYTTKLFLWHCKHTHMKSSLKNNNKQVLAFNITVPQLKIMFLYVVP